jgi:hypothetical protein
MDDEKLQGLSNGALVGRVTQFIRTDFGGEERKERIALQRALEARPGFSTTLAALTPEQQKEIGAAMVSVAEHACLGSRKRLLRTVDEMRRRWCPDDKPPKKGGDDGPDGVIKI